ncbi:hypothetical protein MMMB2_2749 [Mycobacterium marinum MB2]|nr:hypothetical protein MMMB2_2749 [Mycobacterium marinum MB2]
MATPSEKESMVEPDHELLLVVPRFCPNCSRRLAPTESVEPVPQRQPR